MIMGSAPVGKWTEPPLLTPEFPPPPVDRIVVRGARLVKVFDPPGTRRIDGGRLAVIVAWARLPRQRPDEPQQWAALLAWARHWIQENRQTETAYWSWCLLDEALVKPQSPGPPTYEGAEWHGWHTDSQLNVAILGAVATLPEHLRDAASKPAGQQGPGPE